MSQATSPSIAHLWRQAIDRLESEGHGLLLYPVYLIVGRPATGYASFFGVDGFAFGNEDENAELNSDGPFSIRPGGPIGQINAYYLFWKPADHDGASLQDFRDLCGLLRRARVPVFPLHGVAFLLSQSSQNVLDSLSQYKGIAGVLKHELRIHCPTWLVICDIENVAATKLFHRKDEPLAYPFRDIFVPLNADEGTIRTAINSQLDQFFLDDLPSLAHRALTIPKEDGTDWYRQNKELVLYISSWVGSWQANRVPLTDLFACVFDDYPRRQVDLPLGISVRPSQPPSGSTKKEGLLHRLELSRHHVFWTGQAHKLDERLQWWAWCGYVISAVGFLAWLGWIWSIL